MYTKISPENNQLHTHVLFSEFLSKHLTFVEQICKYMLCSGLKIDEKLTQLIANSLSNV